MYAAIESVILLILVNTAGSQCDNVYQKCIKMPSCINVHDKVYTFENLLHSSFVQFSSTSSSVRVNAPVMRNVH